MLTVLKAVLIVTVVGVCGSNKRENITSPERLQRDVLDDYDIQPQSLYGPLPLAYNQPTRNRDRYGSSLLPSKGYGQLNNNGRKYGTRPFPWGGQIQQNRNRDSYGSSLLPSKGHGQLNNYGRQYGTRPSPWGQIQQTRNTDYRLHDESEETRGRFPRPQVLPSSNWRPIPNYGMSPGQYRPQQQNSYRPQPIVPYHYSALPQKEFPINLLGD